MRETTSTQFVMWLKFLDDEINAFDPMKHYFANLTLETRRSYIKDPEKENIDQFLLKFVNKKVDEKEDDDEEDETEDEYEKKQKHLEDKQNLSKAAWFGITGMSKEGKK